MNRTPVALYYCLWLPGWNIVVGQEYCHHARASEDDELRQGDRDTHVQDDENQQLENACREEVRRQTGKSATVLRWQTGEILSTGRLVFKICTLVERLALYPQF